MRKSAYLTVPNIITFTRLAIAPVILYFIIADKEKLFAVFLIINLVSDALDGFLARRLKQVTEFGAKLDAYADYFTIFLAFIGVFVFKMDDIRPHLVSLTILFTLLVSILIISLIRFKKFTTYHPYSLKAVGYIEGVFLICLFTIGFITPFFYFLMGWAIIGAIECIAINLIIPEMNSDIKGLYWVVKERRAHKKITE